MPASPKCAYLQRLDAVRGVAILWVLLFHFFGAIWGWNLATWSTQFDNEPAVTRLGLQAFASVMSRGWLGVPIFFVLSGFLIHFTSQREGQLQLGEYAWRRWSRIFPPYLVALVVFALWYDTVSGKRGWNHLLSHLFLVHNYNKRTFYSINGSFWSLAVEAQFYVLYPLLWRLRQSVSMHAILLTAFAFRLAFGCAEWFEALDPRTYNPVIALCLPRLYFEWILGMYVADCWLQGKPAFGGKSWLAWGCALYAVAAPALHPWDIGIVPAVSLATAFWIDRIAHGGQPAGRFERMLIPLGVTSYSIYLWHQPILNEVTNRVASLSTLTEQLTRGQRHALAFTVSMAAALAISTLMYWAVEVPSQRWGRWMARMFQAARKSPPDVLAAPSPATSSQVAPQLERRRKAA